MSRTSGKKQLQQLMDELDSDEPFMSFGKELVASPAMTASWKHLERKGIVFRKVVFAVGYAYSAAFNENLRLPPREEARGLNEVEKLINELLIAIKRAPSLASKITLYEFGGEEFDDAGSVPPSKFKTPTGAAAFSLAKPAFGFSLIAVPNLSLEEVLEFALPLIKKHASERPARALKRHKETSLATAFVRHLASHFLFQFREKFPSVIASIYAVVFPNLQAIDEKTVTAMLKNSPFQHPPNNM
jgi:hypothetical protein